MQAGNLVTITRTSVGVPANTLALLVEQNNKRRNYATPIWLVQLMDGRTRVFLEGDLELVK